eukprot:m.363822 g.363822  ORF g.363822 m.363822 type:complete len:321 (+) comp24268_c0_seq1:42-1004(+)
MRRHGRMDDAVPTKAGAKQRWCCKLLSIFIASCVVLVVGTGVGVGLYFPQSTNTYLTPVILSPPQQSVSEQVLGGANATAVGAFSVDSTAFVYICDHTCDKELAAASIVTLRHFGGWTGKVFVVTDNATAHFDFGLGSETLIDSHYIERKVPKPHTALMIKPAKLSKPRLLTLIPTQYSTVVYMDVDVLVAQSLEAFSHTCPPTEVWCVFRDILGASTPENTGIMVLRRSPLLQLCLDVWLSVMQKPGLNLDQAALQQALPRCRLKPYIMSRSHVRYVMQNMIVSILPLPGQEQFVHLLGIKRSLSWPQVRAHVLANYRP